MLDAIAIAAQAITGRYLGAGDVAGTRAVTRRMIRWGCGRRRASPACCWPRVSPLLGPLFTGDAAVQDLLVPVLLVAALGQPVAGVVFVLDGVLIGAGDGRYLAWAGAAHPRRLRPGRARLRAPRSAAAWWTIWVVFTVVFMGARFVVLRAPRARRRLAGHRRGHAARSGRVDPACTCDRRSAS